MNEAPATAPRARLHRLLGTAALGLSLLLTGCASQTLFQSSFNANVVGTPPATTQATGTVSIGGAPGSVVVVGPVPGTSENWVQISRSGEQAPISELLCKFSEVKGDGTYTLLAAMFIPSGAGLATVEFDTAAVASPPNTGFLHLDFLQNNTVRINDNNAQVFGSFPRDQFFTLAVTLEITATSAVAHMSLFGTGASGSMDFNVTPVSFARQMGAVKFWMGFPWNGSFKATDILVTRKTS
ncbi:MAG TPA: hypothetical protein VLA16_27760 [Ideonella sp.]|nr:hypothetical protein [Ideonella sp.]